MADQFGGIPVEEAPDYDYKAAAEAGVKPDERGHMPDTYKLPNHITFSEESKYSTPEHQGGKWEQIEGNHWKFTPGPENLRQHSMGELRDYFKRSEPESELVEPTKTDQFGGVPVERPDPEAMLRLGLAAPVTRQMVNSNSYVSNVARAFMSGFDEGGGNAPPLGFTAATTDFLTKNGIFQKDQIDGPKRVAQAFEESFFFPAAIVKSLQTMNALYHGAQAAGIEAGLPPDIVSMPDAFLGSPHPTGMFRAPTMAEMAGKEAVPLNEARDLGVIGPEAPRLDELPPDKAAAAAVKQDKIAGPEPGGGDAWQQRFEHFTQRLDTPQDVKQAILDSAKDNDGFMEARQGDIPLSQVEAVADAAGVDPKSVDQAGLGRLLQNDNSVRGAMQVMLDATENMTNAARAVRADGSPENLIALQESLMRRDMAVEQVVGLRAEWGRTGNVFQEFMKTVKDEKALSDFLKESGRDKAKTPDDLRNIADTLAGLNSPQQVARFANDLRKPSAWDKYLFYWVNALISGPITHLKYIGANAAFAGYEAGIVTPVAGAIGTVRRAITGGDEGVYAGEAAARLYGLLAGTPDAIKAAYRAARENIQVPLPGEIAKNINPVINMKPNPIGGVAGTIIGIPSRGATGIHSFFNFLGYRAEIEAQAYRAAAKEHSPLTDEFWQKRQQLADNPTEGAMDDAIKNGYHLTFISEQGQVGKAISELTRKIPALKLIIPFNHIPGNILRGALEQTPAAFLDERMRADITGKNGAVAQDTQIARLVAGGTISAMVANWALNDRVTGFGPTDETDRAIWLRTHEPYSVRMGGWWVSYNKFGPIGDLFGLVANLVDVGPHVKEGEYAEAAGRVIKGASRLLEDEVGMQGLVNAIEAMEDPDRKMGRFLSSQAASNLPYSSLLRQTASFNDPYMREAKTFVDQLRYSTPFSRQGLLPKIDWLGQPVANPGHQSIIRTRAVNENPIDQEIGRLGGAIKPAPPQDRIGGVKLTPDLYHEYQVKAGALTNTMLSSMVRQPGWDTLPPGIRAKSIHGVIESSRKAAESLMQVTHPALIMQGYKQRLDELINAGRKPRRPPEGLQ